MRPLVLTAAIVLCARPAAGEPAIGMAVGVGQSLGGEAEARLASTIYVLQPLGRWLAGGELAGSIEGYSGGWGCGTASQGPGQVVPSLGVVCARPSLGAHALAGALGGLSPHVQMRLLGGLGATALWLLPSQDGHGKTSLAPSGLLRVDLLVRAGTMLGADWWVGAALEERAVALEGARFSASAGLALEGRSR